MNRTQQPVPKCAAPEGARRVLGIRDAFSAARIQIQSFRDDPAMCWTIRTRFFRAILQPYLIFTGLLGAYLVGRVDGWFIHERLVAVCLWIRPGMFPFPWYAQIVFFPFALSLLLFPLPAYRLSEHQKATNQLVPRQGRQWYVAGLAVAPDFQRRGIAAALLRSGFPGEHEDVRTVVLSCWSNLVGYYERLGFVEFHAITPQGFKDTLHGLEYSGYANSQNEFTTT